MFPSIPRLGATLAAGALLGAALPAPASAQLPVAQRTIVAVGSGSAKPTPADRNSNDSIRPAIEAAEDQALPAAIAQAREYAQKLAAGAGVSLGELLTVSNASSNPYFGGFGFGLAPFGPDRFCGNRRQTVIRRDASGRRRAVGHRTRRVCVVPSQIVQQVTLTFAVV